MLERNKLEIATLHPCSAYRNFLYWNLLLSTRKKNQLLIPPLHRLPCFYRCLEKTIISQKIDSNMSVNCTQLFNRDFLGIMETNYIIQKQTSYLLHHFPYKWVHFVTGWSLQALLTMKCNCIDRRNADINHPLVYGSTLVCRIFRN